MSSYHLKLRKIYLGNVYVYLFSPQFSYSFIEFSCTDIYRVSPRCPALCYTLRVPQGAKYNRCPLCPYQAVEEKHTLILSVPRQGCSGNVQKEHLPHLRDSMKVFLELTFELSLNLFFQYCQILGSNFMPDVILQRFPYSQF